MIIRTIPLNCNANLPEISLNYFERSTKWLYLLHFEIFSPPQTRSDSISHFESVNRKIHGLSSCIGEVFGTTVILYKLSIQQRPGMRIITRVAVPVTFRDTRTHRRNDKLERIAIVAGVLCAPCIGVRFDGVCGHKWRVLKTKNVGRAAKRFVCLMLRLGCLSWARRFETSMCF